MKKMYFLKDRKEAVIDRLTYMSKHRQEYLQGNVILGFFF